MFMPCTCFNYLRFGWKYLSGDDSGVPTHPLSTFGGVTQVVLAAENK